MNVDSPPTNSGVVNLGCGSGYTFLRTIPSDPLQMILESDFYKPCSRERILGMETEKSGFTFDCASF